jgi:hypothetical protein
MNELDELPCWLEEEVLTKEIFDKWKEKPTWTIGEFILLLFDWNPACSDIEYMAMAATEFYQFRGNQSMAFTSINSIGNHTIAAGIAAFIFELDFIEEPPDDFQKASKPPNEWLAIAEKMSISKEFGVSADPYGSTMTYLADDEYFTPLKHEKKHNPRQTSGKPTHQIHVEITKYIPDYLELSARKIACRLKKISTDKQQYDSCVEHIAPDLTIHWRTADNRTNYLTQSALSKWIQRQKKK